MKRAARRKKWNSNRSGYDLDGFPIRPCPCLLFMVYAQLANFKSRTHSSSFHPFRSLASIVPRASSLPLSRFLVIGKHGSLFIFPKEPTGDCNLPPVEEAVIVREIFRAAEIRFPMLCFCEDFSRNGFH